MKMPDPRLLALVALLLSGAAAARDVTVLTGAEVRRNDEYYAYLGALVPLRSADRLGAGWVQRYWVDGLRYGFDVSDPARFAADPQGIRARALGLEAALGYHLRDDRGGVAAYLGFRHQRSTLSPDVPDSRVRGSQWWPKAQVEVDARLTTTVHAYGIAAYTFGLDGYWSRLRVMHDLGGIEVGPEAILQGDRDYRARKVGLVVTGLRLGGSATVGLRAGYHFQANANSPYAGVEFAMGF
jgi:opacity protein-like surface antigen